VSEITPSNPESPKRPRATSAAHARHAFRSRHRSASHANAHADDDPSHRHHKPLDHPLVAPGQAELITTATQLDRLIAHVRELRSFAYDSEFIGELTYRPKLCLLQVATIKQVALIDPLAAELDLRPLWEVLADEAVEKVVHAGEQDLEPVQRLIGKPCANIFDTQVCAAFVGMAYPVSLSKLVAEVTGARLPKGLTFTHWDQRPLSPMQLRYAADDVRYLPAVRDSIGKRLDALAHARWAREECDALCDPARYAFDPNSDFLRVRGAGSLTAAQLAVLRELMIWRDAIAQEVDVPPRAYLRDEVLVDISRHPPKTIDKLARVKGLPRPVEQEHGQEIVELTLRALSSPLTGVPAQPPEPTPTERFRADSLWALVQAMCLSQSLDPNVVVSRQDIVELDRLISAGSDVSQHRLMKSWRGQAVGTALLDIVRNGRTVALGWSESSLRRVERE
jgi:ribonuclease D